MGYEARGGFSIEQSPAPIFHNSPKGPVLSFGGSKFQRMTGGTPDDVGAGSRITKTKVWPVLVFFLPEHRPKRHAMSGTAT
jgi:hypothetical protein